MTNEEKALKLGWDNAVAKEHLKDNYTYQDISAYGFKDGYLSALSNISEAVEKGSIEYAKYVVNKCFFNEPEDTGEIDWVEAKKDYQLYLQDQNKKLVL